MLLSVLLTLAEPRGLGAKMALNWTKIPLHKQIKSITSVANKVKMNRKYQLQHFFFQFHRVDSFSDYNNLFFESA